MNNWIDLQSNTTFEEYQLERRYDKHIRSKFPLIVERTMNRKAMGQSKGKYMLTASNMAQEAAYETHCNAVRVDLEQAKLDNALLKGAIRYERATARLQRYILSQGITQVAGVEEIINPETGEVTQEYVPAIIGIEPIEKTIVVNLFGSEGEITGTKEIPNPLITNDVAERESAQAIIDSASAELKGLIEVRK